MGAADAHLLPQQQPGKELHTRPAPPAAAAPQDAGGSTSMGQQAGGACAEAGGAEAAVTAPGAQQTPQQDGPAQQDSSAGQQHAALRYFNWDQRSTARAAMQTLVAALADDPVNTYFCGTRRRRRFVKDEVKGYLKALPRATHFITTPDSDAVALWQLLPAETPRNELLAGWTRILAVAPRKWAQLLRLELHYEAAHEAAARAHGPYYYLSFIGTAPEARGRGLGGHLLAEVTRRADTEGRWCLLEATSERSEALYARHGFVTHEAFRVAPKAPPVFLMKRAPLAPAGAAAAAPAEAAAAVALGHAAPAPAAAVAHVMVAAPAAVDGIDPAAAAKGLAAAVAAKEAAGCTGLHHQQPQQQQQQPLARRALPQALSSHALIAVGDGAGLLDGDNDEDASDDDGDGISSGDESDSESAPVGGKAGNSKADAHVIIRSASSSAAGLLFKEGTQGGPASQLQAGEKRGAAGSDDDGSSSSSRAGAGGPSSAAAAAAGPSSAAATAAGAPGAAC